MKVSLFKPQAALFEYVESITIISCDFTVDKDISRYYTFVPTHTRFLCFYLEDKLHVKKDMDFIIRERSMIIGPQTTPVTLYFGKKQKTVFVCLKPSGLFRLLGIPLHEIVDKDFDASLLMGKEINILIEQLRNSKTDELKNHLIQLYLLKQLNTLKPGLPFDLAMHQLVRNIGNLSMDFVASQACMSVKQFERKSMERIGFTPKVFARMIRFSHAYKLKELYPQKPWVQIAYECGYFDQMHFIRDFKNFAGFTPSGLTESDIVSSVRFRTLEDR